MTVRQSQLSAAKRALLEKRLQKRMAEMSGEQAIRQRDARRPAALSFAQQRLWFIDQLMPGSAAYNIPVALRLSGALEVSALERSLDEIVRRHEALRTTFALNGERQPAQIIAPELKLSLKIEDLGELPAAEREPEALRRATEEAGRTFDLARGPLVRTRLLRLSAQEHVLLFTMHHIISDGWSMGVLVREVTTLYDAYAEGRPSPLKELSVQYADFAEWQREWLQGEVLAEQLSYWKEQLGGELPALDLPTDRPHPATQSYRGAHEQFSLPKGVSDELKRLGQREGATLFIVLLAAFQALLARYTNQEDILVGSPIANRNRAETEDLIGFFVNTLVLRTDLSGDPTFRELLGRARRTALGAYAHQDLPFEKLVEELHPDRDLGRNPLIQVMFALQNAPMGALELRGLKIEPLEFESSVAKFDLEVYLNELPEGLYGSLTYNADLFEARTMRRFLERFVMLVESVVADPDRRLSELSLLSEDERRQLLVEWNDTSRAYDTTASIQQLFEAQADAAPDAAAFLFEGEQLTYRELNERANRLAWYLKELGAGPETLVGIMAERSPAAVVGLLGIIKAGACYVPLDPTYPSERIAFMLKDSRVGILVTQEKWLDSLPEHSARIVRLDADWPQVARRSAENPPSLTTADNLLYMIYTSGSTGTPKGVFALHGGTLNRFRWMWENYPFEAGEVCCQKTSLSFADSVWEIFGPALRGIPIVIIPDQTVKDAAHLISTLAAHDVSRIVLVPSLLRLILETDAELTTRLPRLKYCVTSGEALPVELYNLFVERMPASRLINLYGSSEASADATFCDLGEGRALSTVPIGRPIANMQVYILDAHGRPAPAGVPGELYLAGVGLGRGYHLRPDWTAERFVPNPFGRAPGERLYRTGDLARYMPDGEIEYLGRVDHQVKIRGFRVETGEIEAALRTHEGVRDAVVVAREDAPGGRSLVAYVVADADGGTKEESVSSSALRSYLKERLPPYMLPSAFVLLEALPLTPSGKVNRRALPAHGGERDAAALRSYVAPGTPVEEMLARIWGEVLKVESIGINDDFFDLGGHSLLATPLVSRVRESFGVDLPLRALFESPTVAGLARHVEAALSAGDKTQARPILPVPRGGKLPLSFAQQRLWFIHELEPSSSAYNIPIAVRFKGRLDLAAMERTLGEIVRRHESLRTTFATSDGEPVQLISPPGELRLHVLDLTHLPEGERTGEAQRLATADAAQPFELERGPLYRAGLLRLSAQDHVLLFTMHHTISDGWSIGVLVNEVAALYSAFAEGRPSPLAPLPIQYADFAHWQRRYLSGEVLESHLKYWGRQLGGTLPALDLPTDRPRPSVQSFRGASQKLNLSAGLVGKLKALARREGVTLFVLLLAGFKSLLYRYTGQEDITVGSPIANRNRSEVEGLIGFFVNTLVLRTDFSGEPTFRELLGRVWAVALESYAHQDMPFEQLVERLQPERSMSRSPLFQVMFHLMNAPRDEVLLPGLTLQPVEVERVATQMDLSLDLFEGENGILVVAEYSTDLFDAATVARLLTHFQTILEGVAENPDRRIAQLPLVAGAEREQILSGWNDTARDYPSDRCLHELFEEQAAGTPDALAVTGDEERLTYAELDGRANQLARHLMALNVGPETLVAVMMDRSVALVVALLGVLKAGAGYVPLDSHYPKQRLAYMLEDSGAAVLLTQEHLLSSLPEHRAAVVVVDGADANPIASRSSLRPAPAAATSEHPAYVIYTSGSTGRPKGVVVSHRAICNRLFWGAEAFPLGVSDRVLQITTVSFDVSVWEFFAPLVAGACLVLARPEDYQDVEYLTGLIEREQVTIINVVPSLLQVLLEDESFARCRSLRQVFVGGEAMPVELPARFFKQSNAELYNLYGPTESTIDATCWKCGPQDGARRSVPIGRPVGNLRAYILDRHLEIVPVGVAGELYIGGAGLARGYLGRPELTAEKFIPNPFGRAPGERLYRTGDLARYLAEGEIEFLRRTDEQVKIRGFRIETGEIEAALLKHPSIKTAVVVVSSPERGRNFSAASGVAVNPELPEAQLAALDPARLAGILAEIEALPD